MKTFYKPIVFGCLILFSSLCIRAQPAATADGAEILQALKKLSVLGSVLYVAAHPDDENTRVLAFLANKHLVRTASLSLTRGDGGQNLIGTEKGALLGLIRTQEMLAARRIDGAEQFFSRAIDFGYSKSAAEALQVWGEEKILSDVVWVVRKFRPDIMITRFTPESGGHGQHLASAILAEKAFHAAGDSLQFPEQLQYVTVWQPKRLFWNTWRRALEDNNTGQSTLVAADVGEYNSLLGKSYTELAAESRSMHKSQGFGASASRGSLPEYFQLTTGEPATQDLFQGVDLTWGRVPGGEGIGPLVEEALRNYDPQSPGAIIAQLIQIDQKLRELPDHYWVEQKRSELQQLLRECSGLWIEAIAEDYAVSPGDRVALTVTVINRSKIPLRLEKLRWPFASSDSLVNLALENNQPLTVKTTSQLPADLAESQPYWLREEAEEGAYRVDDQTMIGLPEAPPSLSVSLTAAVMGETLNYQVPVLYRWTDPVKGEQYRSIDIIPPVTVNFESGLLVFGDQQEKKIGLRIKAGRAGVSGKILLNPPVGWVSSVSEIPFAFENKAAESRHQLTIRPPATPMERVLTAEVVLENPMPAKSLIRIEHAHIPLQTLVEAAEVRLVRVHLQKQGERIGYIMGSGDDIPGALEQIGYQVTLLSDDDLDNLNLSGFDAIVTGIRAYNTRERLKYANKRLLEYVSNGGTLVVQYNTTSGLLLDQIGPYPFNLSHDRVTREDAPVEFVDFEHPLLNFPNRIIQDDLKGWVQERGLYFADQWNSNYQPIFSSQDPGESPKKGGFLYVRYGKGVFIYSGYSWFRQLPAGVPGAYRIFVNMLSAGQVAQR